METTDEDPYLSAIRAKLKAATSAPERAEVQARLEEILAVRRGIDDMRAGRVVPMDVAFARLDKKYAL